MRSDSAAHSRGIFCQRRLPSGAGKAAAHEPREPRDQSARRVSCIAASVIAAFSVAACEPAYVYTDCRLPILSTDESIRTLIKVGDTEDQRRDVCTVPIARKLQTTKSYGSIRFGWWGSPHRLYVDAKTNDGRALDVRGDGIMDYDNASGSWFAEFSHRRSFPGRHSITAARPPPERFAIQIFGPDGQPLDTIQATYDTVVCSCAVPEAFAER